MNLPLKRRLAALQRNGLYENYPQIHSLTGELKKIESLIDIMKMREASGADVEMGMKTEEMEKSLRWSTACTSFSYDDPFSVC